jgi:hypothetical protein
MVSARSPLSRQRRRWTYLDELRQVEQEALRVVDVLEHLHRTDEVKAGLALSLEQILGRLVAVLEPSEARTGSSRACVRARGMWDGVASTPSVCPPSRARLSDSRPAPQPTSSTLRPSSHWPPRTGRPASVAVEPNRRADSSSFCRRKASRDGFILWRSASSPCSSHHWAERRLKCEISSALTEDVEGDEEDEDAAGGADAYARWWSAVGARAARTGAVAAGLTAA